MDFNFQDIILIILYFIVVQVIGFWSRGSDKSNLEYLVAGRKLSLPAFVATLVSTFYGGILGIGEFTYRFGISSWIMNAFPYYVFITFFAFFLAGKIRKTEFYTIPDKLEKVYGKKVSVFGALMVFLLSTPAPYVFMLGILMQILTGLSLNLSIIICLLLSTIYLYKGGLKADIRVNILEFVFMYLGFGIIIPFCFMKIGSLNFLFNNLPETHTSITGGNSIAYIIVWFIIGSWALVDPSFHQRCYAAKDIRTAKKGILISLLFWFLFDAMTTLTGLYAFVHLKRLDNPAMSYPVLANEILPPIAKGLFFIGLIATIMSTLHSYLFISANTIGRDIINRIRNSDDINNKYSKAGIIITSIVSLFIPIFIPSVIQIWYTLGSLTIPALLISVISSYSTKYLINSKYILSAMIVSFFVSFSSFIFIQFISLNDSLIFSIFKEPIFPGLICGFCIYIIGYYKQRINRNC